MMELNEEYVVDPQFAENEDIENQDDSVEQIDCENEYIHKRELLEKTKLVKQTWSILEIIQKMNEEKLILDPDYQRAEVWNQARKASFIESLYMGIIIPPIYVVEIPGDDMLAISRYEVVDGKQRLTAIKDFVHNKLIMNKKALEYYGDIFDGKSFSEIKESLSEKTVEMLSSILDIYVITANSPEFTKYDIFARLNKGAEPLKVNEIRRAIYRSSVTEIIKSFVEEYLESEKDSEAYKKYTRLFSKNAIKHFEDYGRFYRSVAFYIRSDKSTLKVDNYNSRPRDMINDVLQKLQENKISMDEETVINVLNRTIELLDMFANYQNKEYLVDGCIPFIDEYWENIVSKQSLLMDNEELNKTFLKSPATTSNVNERLRIIYNLVKE